ncbi:transposase family protein [Waterburya agarophytonicola]|uniref:transposase family protein n=1 Tax=Waterburya agarophytonicola TaxID=2886916 RepID=UPI003F6F2997
MRENETQAQDYPVDHFAKLTDPRIDRTKEHKLIDILAIAICGMICGAALKRLS